jgi:nucleoside-diphosphate-sugar epimerase
METTGVAPKPGQQGLCLIAGCGYTGTRLARRLTVLGPVLALARSQVHAEALVAAGIPALAADLDGPFAVAIPKPEAIVYSVPPAPRGSEDPRLQRFLEGLGEARPAVLVYLSTTGVYGDADGLPVDENRPPEPEDDAGRRRLAAEETALAWCQARGTRCVVLRVSGIYGPHRLPLERLQRGEPVLWPEESTPGNRIHVDDLVEACVAALRGPAAGRINVADGDHRSIGAFLELVARVAGLPPPRRVTMAEARQEVSPGMLAFLLVSKRVINRRLREELGVSLRYADPEAGVRASLREMDWPSTEAG